MIRRTIPNKVFYEEGLNSSSCCQCPVAEGRVAETGVELTEKKVPENMEGKGCSKIVGVSFGRGQQLGGQFVTQSFSSTPYFDCKMNMESKIMPSTMSRTVALELQETLRTMSSDELPPNPLKKLMQKLKIKISHHPQSQISRQLSWTAKKIDPYFPPSHSWNPEETNFSVSAASPQNHHPISEFQQDQLEQHREEYESLIREERGLRQEKQNNRLLYETLLGELQGRVREMCETGSRRREELEGLRGELAGRTRE